MGVKLMTGATGEQNIQAADDRECLAGITGRDSYVFPTGSKLKATLVDANTVTIGTGAGSLQGSRFRCSTTTTVTSQSGTQGQYRRDIVGLRFKRESSGRESMEFQVLTGDPASSDGAASDPSYTEGDLLAGDAEAFMPLYRVKLSGINAADPEPLFSVLTPLADLGDSVSQLVDESGDQYLYGGPSSGDKVFYHRVGSIVEMFWNFLQESAQVWNAGTLPVGYRPRTDFLEPAVRTYSSGLASNNTAEVEVTAHGRVNFFCPAAAVGGRNIGHCVWIAA